MYLGIDLGTTNVKAIAVAESGDIVGRGNAPVERFQTEDRVGEQSGLEQTSVEQDSEQIWQATRDAIHAALKSLNAAEVLAVGISSQGCSLQILDEQEQPFGRVVSWMDGRGQSYDKHFTEQLGSDFFSQRLGHGKSALAIGQLLRIHEEAPEKLTSATQIAFVGDVIVGRLCGRRAHDASSLAIALLYNPKLGRADPELLDYLNISEEQLPDLLPATTPAGTVTSQGADETGLPAGIPVSPAVHDQYAAALGSGSTEAGSLMLGTGTSWVQLANCATLASPVTADAFVSKHVVEGLYGQLLSMGCGGSAIAWAMQLFGLGDPNREKVDELLAAAPPGSDGLRFWPMFSPYAAGIAGIDARASGIKLSHSAKHFVRSLVEGLACELARFIRIFSDAGMPVERLNLCGEAAASDFTSQIIANVIGKPIRCFREPAVSALGAAILARALTSTERADLSALSRRFSPAGTTIYPDENQTLYQAILTQYLEQFANHPTCHPQK